MLQLPKRLQSIDIFRALTMFFMIFVNDVDGVTNIPTWIKHAHADEDALGFADTIFPLFLFIVGLSIPLAFNKRMKSGEKKLNIAVHILLRSLALIVMGVFHVNLENYSDTAFLPKAVFEIIITLAFFLIWLDYKNISATKENLLKATGIIMLIAMAFLYKGEMNNAIVGMRTQWWGILGLIGWGYLTCSLIYLFFNGDFYAMIIALIFLLFFNIITHLPGNFFQPIQSIPLFVGHGAMAGLIMAGVVTSLVYSRTKQSSSNRFFSTFIILSAVFIVFGFLTRPIAGISKIHDTPAWVGICTGIGIAVFAFLIYLTDIKGKGTWFEIIKPAGTSTLTCYLLPYLLYSLFLLINFNYPYFLSQGIGGIIRSFAVAFVVIFITGLLEKKHLR